MKDKVGKYNIFIGDYPGCPDDSYNLIIGIKGDYFKTKITKRQYGQISRGLNVMYKRTFKQIFKRLKEELT